MQYLQVAGMSEYDIGLLRKELVCRLHNIVDELGLIPFTAYVKKLI